MSSTFALEGEELILATEAKRHKDYLCLDCKQPVRVRGGPHRQFHFYHLRSHAHCSQHKKGLEHLQAQMQIQSLIGNDAEIEFPFPSIGRIADVVWHKEKIVFEVQCSPMSKEEAQNRIRDYESAGYSVAWVLHDRRYNKKNLSAVENYLREQGCFFTDMDPKGFGLFYDQHEVIQRGKRIHRGPRLKVDITKPLRKDKRPLYFAGDLFSRLKEDKIDPRPKNTLSFWARLYREIYYHFLLKCTRN